MQLHRGELALRKSPFDDTVRSICAGLNAARQNAASLAIAIAIVIAIEIEIEIEIERARARATSITSFWSFSWSNRSGVAKTT